MSWKVWLADGTTFSSEEGGPDDIPVHPRVTCVAQTGKAEKTWGFCLTGGDWYLYREDLACWTEHTDMGALMEMADHAPYITACRAGKYIDTPTFKEVWAEARKWASR